MWIPKHPGAAERKARKVAKFYQDYRRAHRNQPPTLKAIGLHFGHSYTWARNYMALARAWGYVGEHE